LPKVRLSLALAEDENQAESSRRIVVSRWCSSARTNPAEHRRRNLKRSETVAIIPPFRRTGIQNAQTAQICGFNEKTADFAMI
jgi:hypothetical protein